jgi:hypothetical protein
VLRLRARDRSAIQATGRQTSLLQRVLQEAQAKEILNLFIFIFYIVLRDIEQFVLLTHKY